MGGEFTYQRKNMYHHFFLKWVVNSPTNLKWVVNSLIPTKMGSQTAFTTKIRKIGSKMGGAPTNQNGIDQNNFDHSQIGATIVEELAEAAGAGGGKKKAQRFDSLLAVGSRVGGIPPQPPNTHCNLLRPVLFPCVGQYVVTAHFSHLF